MNRETISNALEQINDKYIEEAEMYRPKKFLPGFIGIAAAFSLIFLTAWFTLASSVSVTVYAQDTGEEITETGAVLHTGTIDSSGEQTGHPLMFYLSGKHIERVRFSCRNQSIYFMDWTEKRDEFGSAQNFTVEYGPDPSEYYYLLIDWMPYRTLAALHEPGASIAALPPELREDTIVLEITFSGGKTITKAIEISLLEDGSFFASFGEYRITDKDDFILRPDAPAIPREILYGNPLS